MNDRFRLNLNVHIETVDEHGNPQGMYNGGLRLEESLNFRADSFLQVASILGKFHDLSEQLKAVPPNG